MTDAEKNGVRNGWLDRYRRAVDEQEASCGLLAELIERLRDIVRLYDDGSLHVTGAPDKLVFGHGQEFSFKLPSHDELASTFVACEKARREEERVRTKALKAGVDRRALESVREPR